MRGERVGEVAPEVSAAARPRRRVRTARASARPRPDDAAGCSRSRWPRPPAAAKSSSHASTSRANSGCPGSVPPSRTHSSAYESGSRLSRSTTHASSGTGDSSTQSRTRSSPSTPSRVSQLPSSCATPPGARWAPAPRTNAATRSSPTSPPSRYSYAGTPSTRGVMTNGGFDDDAIELLSRDRLEQAARPQLDPVDVVEQRVEPREAQRALRDVGRDDLVDAPSRAQRLDAAPGADVEPARRGRGQLQRRERQRRAADAQHVVFGQRTAQRRLVEVARDPPPPAPAASTNDCGGRARGDGCRSPPARRARGRSSPSPPGPGQRRIDDVGGLRHPEHQEPCEDRERVLATLERPLGREAQPARDRIVGDVAPRRSHVGAVVPGIAQIGGERAHRAGSGIGSGRVTCPFNREGARPAPLAATWVSPGMGSSAARAVRPGPGDAGAARGPERPDRRISLDRAVRTSHRSERQHD